MKLVEAPRPQVLPELSLRARPQGSHSLLSAGWRPVPTPHVEIRYRVRAGLERSQEETVRHWLRAVREIDPDAIETSVLRTEDGRTFVHRLWFGSEMAGRQWQSLPAQRHFRDETARRCDEPPEILHLEVLVSTVLEATAPLGSTEAAGATL
ncbi:MAG: hypothetical protein AAGA81_15860 [Acidobacteriota bacterium]